MYVGSQEFDIVFDGLRDLTLDAVQRMQGLGELVFLEMNSRKPVGRIVSYDVVNGSLEHGLDGPPGPVVHAIAQLEITQ